MRPGCLFQAEYPGALRRGGKKSFPFSTKCHTPKKKNHRACTGHLTHYWGPIPGLGSHLMIVRSSCCTAKMGRYCRCSRIDFFLANSLLASLFFFMWSANFCSVLRTHRMRPKIPAQSHASSLLTGLLPCFLCPEVRTAPNTQRIFKMWGLPAAAHLLQPKGPHCYLSIHHPKPANTLRTDNHGGLWRAADQQVCKSSALEESTQMRSSTAQARPHIEQPWAISAPHLNSWKEESWKQSLPRSDSLPPLRSTAESVRL